MACKKIAATETKTIHQNDPPEVEAEGLYDLIPGKFPG